MVEAKGGCEHKINTAHCKGCLVFISSLCSSLKYSSIPFPKFAHIIQYSIVTLQRYSHYSKSLSQEDTVGVGLRKHTPSRTAAPKQLQVSLSLFTPWHLLCF